MNSLFKITLGCYLFAYAFCCHAQTNTFMVLKAKSGVKTKQVHIASLDAHNKYVSKFNDCSINLIEKNETSYLLCIYAKNNQLIYKSSCQGISQIYEDSVGIYLLEYSLFTEDGHTEGKIITFDAEQQRLLKSKYSYANCTNPMRFDGKLWVISEMKLLQFNAQLAVESRRKIDLYKSNKEVTATYADTYRFYGLDNEGNEISVNFTPYCPQIADKKYTGQLNVHASRIHILLN